ncbi:MAG TPA: DUF2934 domain-containing protein [Beijerinckiaceae bacterium]|jgi:hypothetical protein
MDIQQRIQERAYALWLEDGCVHGRAREHWLRAERELSHAPAVEAKKKVTPRKTAQRPAKRAA